jgi:hypothetical protein
VVFELSEGVPNGKEVGSNGKAVGSNGIDAKWNRSQVGAAQSTEAQFGIAGK